MANISIQDKLLISSPIDRLRGTGGVVVALSGGVDSGVLLMAAVEALGRDRVLAVTGRSPSVPERDLRDATLVARFLGAPHEFVETHEIERPAYRANAGDRCFHCRTELFEALFRIAGDRGLPAVAYGAIHDDLGDDRPGMKAAASMGVLAPLLDAGLTKDDVRRLARGAGLPVREKPAAACLSSRIPPGSEVTPEKLRQVEAAEESLRALGFRVVRVRHHGGTARVEIGKDEMSRLSDPEAREAIEEGVRSAGFLEAVVDPDGYRPGGAAKPPSGLLAIGNPGAR